LNHRLRQYIEDPDETGEGKVDSVRKTCCQIRERFRMISKESGVPIEPEKQTELLDEVMS